MKASHQPVGTLLEKVLDVVDVPFLVARVLPTHPRNVPQPRMWQPLVRAIGEMWQVECSCVIERKHQYLLGVVGSSGLQMCFQTTPCNDTGMMSCALFAKFSGHAAVLAKGCQVILINGLASSTSGVKMVLPTLNMRKLIASSRKNTSTWIAFFAPRKEVLQ